MSWQRFTITRADGRSNAEVLIDIVAAAEPDSLHPYEALAEALSVGADHAYTKPQVQRIVASALKTLGRRTKRTLQCVPGVGYRVAFAREHVGLAVKRRDKADRQLVKGLHLLQDVRFDELDPNTRKAHEAQLLILSAVYQQQTALEARMSKTEDLIAAMLANTGQAG